MTRDHLSIRGQIALAAGRTAKWASKLTGRGAGSMIGGLVGLKLDDSLLSQLGRGRQTVLITGTNGKSTTTRMVAAALATVGPVATNSEGSNMDAGLVAALARNRQAELAVLEVDELHLPHVADALNPAVIVLLNLSRDQLDRVGEINNIERTLRRALTRHRDAVIVANCDDVLMTSAAYESPKVIWVAAGGNWAGDSVSCPRTGEPIGRRGDHWYSKGTYFARPKPDWWFDDDRVYGPDGISLQMSLTLPGTANRGNATLAVAAATHLGARSGAAVDAVSHVDEVAGRYRSVPVGEHNVRLLLAKNPAGWQEALSMVDTDADGLVIAVNGQVPDGEDLSWLWDVNFEHFATGDSGDKSGDTSAPPVVASGERGTDLAVRLTYAGVAHTLHHDPVKAIAACPAGKVDVIANYTAFLNLNRALNKRPAAREKSSTT